MGMHTVLKAHTTAVHKKGLPAGLGCCVRALQTAGPCTCHTRTHAPQAELWPPPRHVMWLAVQGSLAAACCTIPGSCRNSLNRLLRTCMGGKLTADNAPDYARIHIQPLHPTCPHADKSCIASALLLSSCGTFMCRLLHQGPIASSGRARAERCPPWCVAHQARACHHLRKQNRKFPPVLVPGRVTSSTHNQQPPPWHCT
jgi:hypothetical protein